MGAVFSARQASLGRDVAIKVVKGGAQGGAQAEALLTEGRAMGRVEHPNVVPVHAIGWDEHGDLAPSARLLASIEALDAEIEAREAKNAELALQARERDVPVSLNSIGAVFLVHQLWTLLVTKAAFAATSLLGEGPTYRRAVEITVGLAAFPLGVALIARKRMLARLADRWFFASFVIYGFTGLVNLARAT